MAAIAGLATPILVSRRGHQLLGLVTCAATGLLIAATACALLLTRRIKAGRDAQPQLTGTHGPPR